MQFLFTSAPIDVCTKQCIVKTLNEVNEETFCQNPYFLIFISMNEIFKHDFLIVIEFHVANYLLTVKF